MAHSSLVTVEGAVTADALVLRLRRSADQQPVTGAELAVSVDGRSLPVTSRPEGSWNVPLRDLPAKADGRFSIVVSHDGVREVLDGRLPGGAPPPSSGSGGWVSTLMHKQMAWWILNVIIVLIGVVAVSRRTSGGS